MIGAAASNASASPPAMTVRMPASAPACPPETGASMQRMPITSPALNSSRATSAEAVVWSMNVVPRFMVRNTPSGPRVICLRSSSLPTQENTKSAPAAASAGVAAVRPP